MKSLINRRNIYLFIICFFTFWYLIVEIKFLITEKYKSAFFDFLWQYSIIIITVLIISLLSFQLNRIIKSKLRKYLLISIISCSIITISFITKEKLNTNGFAYYRMDFGISALHLYLDNSSDKYVVIFSYPFGASIMVGKYFKQNYIVILDKNLKFDLDLPYEEFRAWGSSLDLKKMTKLN